MAPFARRFAAEKDRAVLVVGAVDLRDGVALVE
jgi:hypothetical protein